MHIYSNSSEANEKRGAGASQCFDSNPGYDTTTGQRHSTHPASPNPCLPQALPGPPARAPALGPPRSAFQHHAVRIVGLVPLLSAPIKAPSNRIHVSPL